MAGIPLLLILMDPVSRQLPLVLFNKEHWDQNIELDFNKIASDCNYLGWLVDPVKQNNCPLVTSQQSVGTGCRAVGITRLAYSIVYNCSIVY